ncbi:MAG: arylsulfatase, partial [Verrucomicrobiota bacterium]
MITKWKDMTENVLRSEKIANRKMSPIEVPRTNKEWTVFSDSTEPPAAKSRRNQLGGPDRIRARKNTKLVRQPGTLLLTFTGEDPGIALDLRGLKLRPTGPYQVSFNLFTNIAATGDIFFTTDGKTVLPNGENRKFPVIGSDGVQLVCVDLETDEQIHQLRIDVSDGEGAAEISNLRLLGPEGEVIKDWTSAE